MLLDMLQEKRANLPALAAEDLFSGMLQSRLGKMIVKRAGLKYQTPLQSLNDEQLLALRQNRQMVHARSRGRHGL